MNALYLAATYIHASQHVRISPVKLGEYVEFGSTGCGGVCPTLSGATDCVYDVPAGLTVKTFLSNRRSKIAPIELSEASFHGSQAQFLLQGGHVF